MVRHEHAPDFDAGAYFTTETFEPEPPVKAAPATRKQRKESRPPVRFKTVAEFCGEYVPLAYAIEGIVRTNSLYSLTGRTGSGKTALMVAAALAATTGRSDILGRDVEQGRVSYLAFENPDDVRMKFKIAAFLLNVDLGALGDRLVILDRRDKPEAILAELSRLAEAGGPFSMVLADTFAAWFDGKDINDNVESGEFTRRLRPFTQLPGLPAVIVGAHPVKNASADNLIPYGGGAILNEFDGNLTLWQNPETRSVSMHWQGKLRGLDFTPVPFRFEVTGSPDILDVKGRQVQLPTLMPSTPADVEARADERDKTNIALLRAMLAEPDGTQTVWANLIGRSKSTVNGHLQALKKEKLVDEFFGKWIVSGKGKKALEIV